MSGEVFKELSELEEFFKNLGIEYRFSCYYEKNGEGCHLLGTYMAQIQDDLVRASRVWKDNCNDNGFAKSCTAFGTCLLKGRGGETDVKKSVEYYSKGCELGDNEGCFYAGQLLSGTDQNYVDQIEPRIKKSVEYLEKGCEMTKNVSISGECCFYVHSLYLMGKQGCDKNAEKAFKYALKGCEYENMNSCNNLGQMYSLGVGTERDERMAKRYKDKTLDMLDQMEKQRNIETQRT